MMRNTYTERCSRIGRHIVLSARNGKWASRASMAQARTNYIGPYINGSRVRGCRRDDAMYDAVHQ